MPCDAERQVSLKCAEKYRKDEEKKSACSKVFEEYSECKKRAMEEKKLKNNGVSLISDLFVLD